MPACILVLFYKMKVKTVRHMSSNFMNKFYQISLQQLKVLKICRSDDMITLHSLHFAEYDNWKETLWVGANLMITAA